MSEARHLGRIIETSKCLHELALPVYYTQLHCQLKAPTSISHDVINFNDIIPLTNEIRLSAVVDCFHNKRKIKILLGSVNNHVSF